MIPERSLFSELKEAVTAAQDVFEWKSTNVFRFKPIPSHIDTEGHRWYIWVLNLFFVAHYGKHAVQARLTGWILNEIYVQSKCTHEATSEPGRCLLKGLHGVNKDRTWSLSEVHLKMGGHKCWWQKQRRPALMKAVHFDTQRLIPRPFNRKDAHYRRPWCFQKIILYALSIAALLTWITIQDC